jgi:hypothetical protein
LTRRRQLGGGNYQQRAIEEADPPVLFEEVMESPVPALQPHQAEPPPELPVDNGWKFLGVAKKSPMPPPPSPRLHGASAAPSGMGMGTDPSAAAQNSDYSYSAQITVPEGAQGGDFIVIPSPGRGSDGNEETMKVQLSPEMKPGDSLHLQIHDVHVAPAE